MANELWTFLAAFLGAEQGVEAAAAKPQPEEPLRVDYTEAYFNCKQALVEVLSDYADAEREAFVEAAAMSHCDGWQEKPPGLEAGPELSHEWWMERRRRHAASMLKIENLRRQLGIEVFTDRYRQFLEADASHLDE